VVNINVKLTKDVVNTNIQNIKQKEEEDIKQKKEDIKQKKEDIKQEEEDKTIIKLK
jgi:hypothetical protein